jgi:hypothetical protein
MDLVKHYICVNHSFQPKWVQPVQIPSPHWIYSRIKLGDSPIPRNPSDAQNKCSMTCNKPPPSPNLILYPNKLSIYVSMHIELWGSPLPRPLSSFTLGERFGDFWFRSQIRHYCSLFIFPLLFIIGIIERFAMYNGILEYGEGRMWRILASRPLSQRTLEVK